MEILTPKGWKYFNGITKKNDKSVKITHTYGSLICSLNHIFIINGKETFAKSLKPGDKLNKKIQVISIKLHEKIDLYDIINVDDGNIYYHDNKIVSHNCEFLGSSRTLLTGSTLARLSFTTPLKEYSEGTEKGLRIYKYPEKNRVYTLTADTSRGRHLDYSCFIVFDITEYPHTISAIFRNNEIPPMMYASLIHSIAKKYNNAYTLVEINDIGGQVADILWNELEYEELFWTKSGDMLGKKGSDPYPGIRTTEKTKRIGCANLKDMVENNQLLINDSVVIQELSTFIQKENGKYSADEGFHDDSVMCLILQAWMTTQSWFSELTDSHLRTVMHNLHVKEMEDSLCMPIFHDGTEDDNVFGYWNFNV